ncbi:hypothetical protein [Sphingomonas bacterium]|uniref:hypothetical protein n=1 Tax=Sphingomonas bacterium TaxID=1895847 RepID=UPI001574F7E6|nr:hypothetical protein [Sphingomonas bacterium]
MTVKTSLLAGAAVLALTGAAGAEAAPVRHHAHHAAARPAANKSEIDALKAQVAELTARLDAQEEAQRATQAQASVAQTQAADATVKADTAQSTALAAQQAAPAQVAAAIGKLPKPKPSWADSTVLSGRMYFNFSNINQLNNGARQGNDGTGFDIKRFYFGVDHKFNNVFAANLTMDVSNVVGNTSNYNFPGAQSNAATSITVPATCVTGTVACTVTVPAQTINNNLALVGRGFYIKKAYLEAKLSPALIIRAGSADTPWVPYVDNQTGYRHIENSLIDRTGYGTSADWGIHVLGDMFDKIVSYQVSVIDGGGYRNVKVTNSVDFEGRLSAQYDGFFGAVGGYSGKRATNVQGLVLPAGLTNLHTATRLDAMVGYKVALLTVSGEYFHAKDWNNVATVAEDKTSGYSLFASVAPIPKWSAFGRFDWVKPTELTDNALRDHYFNMGLQYEPVKIVDLALVYKREAVDNGLLATQNGTIGGANAAGLLTGGRGTYDEIGLFGQLRF